MTDGKAKRTVFKQCAAALLQRQAGGKCTNEHKAAFLAAHDALARLTMELLSVPRGENTETKLRARTVMERFDPHTNYYFTVTVAREMLDAALTLRILGERPKVERDAIPWEKIYDATALCQVLQHELPR